MSAPEPQFIQAARSLARERGESLDMLLERHRQSSIESEYPTRDCLSPDYVDSLGGQVDRMSTTEQRHVEACGYCSVMVDEMTFGSSSFEEFAHIVRAVSDETRAIADTEPDMATVCLLIKPRSSKWLHGAVSGLLAEHWLSRLDLDSSQIADTLSDKGDLPGSRCAQFSTVRDAVGYAEYLTRLLEVRGDFTCHVGVSTRRDAARRTQDYDRAVAEIRSGGEAATAAIATSLATWLASVAEDRRFLVTESVATALDKLSESGDEAWEVRKVGNPPEPSAPTRLLGKRSRIARGRRLSQGQPLFEVARAAFS